MDDDTVDILGSQFMGLTVISKVLIASGATALGAIFQLALSIVIALFFFA